MYKKSLLIMNENPVTKRTMRVSYGYTTQMKECYQYPSRLMDGYYKALPAERYKVYNDPQTADRIILLRGVFNLTTSPKKIITKYLKKLYTSHELYVWDRALARFIDEYDEDDRFYSYRLKKTEKKYRRELRVKRVIRNAINNIYFKREYRLNLPELNRLFSNE